MFLIDPKKILKLLGVAAVCVFGVFYMYRLLIGTGRETLETENALSVT